MILEVAILNVRPKEEAAFEKAFALARPLIAATNGFRGIELRRCVESKSRYLLLVTWETVDDHVIGFRQSRRYDEWRKLLHHFYDPFPTVEHYGAALALG
jgi:heme-degrading monooxygenase HmoA